MRKSLESLADDLQRAEGECEKARAALPRLYHVLADHLVGVEAERAECAQLLLLRETEIEEGDAAYRIVADQLAACHLARQCADRDLAAARAECEKADDWGTRAELARLKLAGELAAVEDAHAMANRTNAALLGQRTALRERLAQAREALRKWAVHPEGCAALQYDPPRVDSVRLVQILRGSGMDFREGDAAKCDCGLAALLAEEARDGTG